MSSFSNTFNLNDLNGTIGFTISGINKDDLSGSSVSNAGDVNGDGIDDIIIGASATNVRLGREFIGESYVVFGSREGFSRNLDLSTLDGRNGFVVSGLSRIPGRGFSVSGAGDVNSDGIDDLIVGSGFAAPDGRRQAGESYVIFGSREGFSQKIESSTLDGSNGFVFEGVRDLDYLGYSVSDAGDVNGDGIDDVIIGAYGVSSSDTIRIGQSYVIFGSRNGFNPKLGPADLDGSNGFVINGVRERDFLGYSVSGAGDVNGDGVDDVVIRALRDGKSYVVFGSSEGFSQSIDISELDGTNGFALSGSSGVVSSAGDINGDGFEDFVVGGPPTGTYVEPPFFYQSGYTLFGSKSYVVFGFEDTLVSDIDLSSLDGSDGFSIEVGRGPDSLESYGRSVVSGAGDINGDGFDDVIIGFYSIDIDEADSVGKSYVVFGSDSGIDNLRFNDLSGNSELDSSNGFEIAGLSGYDSFGRSVSGAGDVNGDGIDDVIIGAPGAEGNNQDKAGQSYVIFGRIENLSLSLDSSSLTEGTTTTGTVTRSGPTTNDLIVTLSSRASQEVSIPATVVIAAGETQASFSVAALTDGLVDGEQTIRLTATANDGGLSLAETALVITDINTPTLPPAFSAPLNFAELDGSNGFAINGIDINDFSGVSVSSAGDVNGDGVDDIIIGARRADGATGAGREGGESYVVFGSRDGFSEQFELADLDGRNGFIINGAGQSGTSVSNAGDINGDGIDDVIVGAPGSGFSSAATSQSYVVFGSLKDFSRSIDASDLDGQNGFIINGAGTSVSSAGDVNSDGIDDIIIGAPTAQYRSTSGQRLLGQSYVLFGDRDGFGRSFDLSTLEGSNGFVFNGINGAGESVSSAGDINGDGIDDIIIGAPDENADGIRAAGRSYVVFGSQDGFTQSIDSSALSGSNGFIISGISQASKTGLSVSGAGDINGDGIDDIIIGAFDVYPGSTINAGQSYVVFGSREGFSRELKLADLNGNNGFAITGAESGRVVSVSGAGDINGDGFDDVLIRVGYQNVREQKEAYVVFGSREGFSRRVELSDSGFLIDGDQSISDSSGFGYYVNSASDAGDINGDGIDDIIIGAGFGGAQYTGESYVVFGRAELSLSLASNSITEGGTLTGTLVRTTSTNSDLVVSLSSSDSSEITVPATVTIAAGETQATFNVSAPTDGLIDGNQTVTITASSGSIERVASLEVVDDGIQTSNATIFADANNVIRGNAFFAGFPYQGRLLSSTDNDDISPDDIIAGTEGNDSIWAGKQGDDAIEGNGGDDIIGIGSGSSTVTTESGDDFVYSITSSSGNNVIELGEGNNNAWLLSGDNRILAGSGRDVIGLGTGSDVVRITGGNNVLYRAASGNSDGNKDILTGVGDDYMELGTGDDLINAGGGLNTLFGGAGADTFVVRRGAYNFLGDFELGIDKIELASISSDNLRFFQGTGEKASNVFGFVGFEAIFEVVDTTVEQIQLSNTFV